MGRGRLTGPTEERVTFDQLSADLIRDYETNGRRSIASAKLSVAHLREHFGLDRALDITTDRIRAYIGQRKRDAASNASINRELSALKRMFTLAIQANKFTWRPYIPTLEENNARQGFLEHGAFVALRGALPEYLRDPVTFLYHSGWRVSEMRTLEWRDVYLDSREVRLRPELSKNKDGRVLPLDADLLTVFERAKSKRKLDCVRVFHSDGKPVGDFKKSWKSACKTAKLQGTLVHDLRRTAVRNMIRASVPERLAMAISGHKTRSVVDRYNIVSESDLRDAADRLQTHLDALPTTATVTVLRAASE